MAVFITFKILEINALEQQLATLGRMSFFEMGHGFVYVKCVKYCVLCNYVCVHMSAYFTHDLVHSHMKKVE